MRYKAIAGYKGEQVWQRVTLEHQGLAGFLYMLSRKVHDEPNVQVDRIVITSHTSTPEMNKNENRDN